MNVLALDTSSPLPAVALATGADLLEERLAPGRRVAEELLPAVARLLARAGRLLPECDRVAVCAGPGSFTGLRVGLAAAWGFGRGCGMPVEAVSTLEAMAEAARAPGRGEVFALLDAGRDELILARYALQGPRAEPLWGPRRATRQEAARRVAGNATIALPEDLLGPADAYASESPARALAAAVARAPRAGSALSRLTPLYGRDSAAQEKHGASTA
jgi:tRNA threonylcarbamoyladenosine biosynthesis protein TsaB